MMGTVMVPGCSNIMKPLSVSVEVLSMEKSNAT